MAIERHHYFRLTDAFSNPEARQETVRRTIEALQSLPMVRSISGGVPADEHAQDAWDLFLTIRFDGLDDVDAYRAHPDHRRFVDEFLGPRIAVKKIWNFVVE